jgi:hypothetical protein
MRRILVFAALIACVGAYAQGFAPPSPEAQAKAAAQLKKFEKEYTAAKAAYAKKPKDKKAKDRFIAAATKYGHESMTSDALPPRVKYRQTLRIYREVLKLDPKNPVAKPESDLIIKIYKDMGRPVPK